METIRRSSLNSLLCSTHPPTCQAQQMLVCHLEIYRNPRSLLVSNRGQSQSLLDREDALIYIDREDQQAQLSSHQAIQLSLTKHLTSILILSSTMSNTALTLKISICKSKPGVSLSHRSSNSKKASYTTIQFSNCQKIYKNQEWINLPSSKKE